MSKKVELKDETNSDLGAVMPSFTIDDLRKAFEAGRTVSNYKDEWQETYSDNYTSEKYEKFEDWLKTVGVMCSCPL